MTTLGKCLLFYLKYAAEMERLYEAEVPRTDGLPDPDRVLKQISRVGDIACREGADLLEACVPGIEAHFGAISTIERVNSNLVNLWELKFRVSPKRSPNKRFMIGVTIEHAPNPVALIPWVGCRRGRRAVDEVIQVLGRGKKSGEGWLGGVWVSEIKIPIPERLDAPVAADPLVTQVQQSFASFTADNVRAIGVIASNGGE